MNIQQLRYVVATADLGSMTAAASSLYVAQPALSRAVRQLERELEVPIFRRAGRGIVLTAQGEAVVARARRVLRNVDALRQLSDRDERGADESPIVIAASPTLQASLALPVLAILREQGVATPVRLMGCGGSAEVHAIVTEGRAAVGLCDQEIDSDLEVVPLGRVEVVLLSPAGLDLPDPVALAELDGMPFVLPTVGTDRRAALDWFFREVGVAPVAAVESDERSVWIECVRRGLASCIWHSVQVQLFLESSDVAVRSFDPPLHQQLTAVHRPGARSPVEVHLLDALRDYAGLSTSATTR